MPANTNKPPLFSQHCLLDELYDKLYWGFWPFVWNARKKVSLDKPFVGVGDEVVSMSVLSGLDHRALSLDCGTPDIGTGCWYKWMKVSPTLTNDQLLSADLLTSIRKKSNSKVDVDSGCFNLIILSLFKGLLKSGKFIITAYVNILYDKSWMKIHKVWTYFFS